MQTLAYVGKSLQDYCRDYTRKEYSHDQFELVMIARRNVMDVYFELAGETAFDDYNGKWGLQMYAPRLSLTDCRMILWSKLQMWTGAENYNKLAVAYEALGTLCDMEDEKLLSFFDR